MKIETLKLAALIPYEKNSRVHPPKQIALLVKNIEKFGFTSPCLVDEKNNVIAGHGRLLAVKELGWDKVPCVRIEGLTEKEVKALRLADNQLASMADWDMQLVIDEIRSLEDDALVALSGFEKDLLIEPDEKDDIIPDNVETKVKLGDIWQLGRHRVMWGDSTQQEAVLRLMEGKKADEIITDPPYGMNLETDYTIRNNKPTAGYNGLGVKYGTRGKYPKVIGDDKPYLPEHIFRDFDYCKEIFLWGGDYYSENIPNVHEGGWFAWDKRIGIEDIKFTASEFEMCWSRKKHLREIIRERWFGAHGTQNQDQKKRSHPTQKPLGVNTFFIRKFTKDDDLVVDLFLGTGSCLIACEKTGRICYGMELSEKYCDVILQRYKDYTGIEPIKVV